MTTYNPRTFTCSIKAHMIEKLGGGKVRVWFNETEFMDGWEAFVGTYNIAKKPKVDLTKLRVLRYDPIERTKERSHVR